MKDRVRVGESAGKDSPTLAITLGDPCGIGPEIVLKTLAVDLATAAARLVVVGDEGVLRRTARSLKLRWPFGLVIRDWAAARRSDKPILFDLADADESLFPGQISALAGRVAAEAIEKAVEFCQSGRADGVVTAPIHKEALALAGWADPGHTEMLARLTGTRRVAMTFWTEDFSVALLSTHTSLTSAIRQVRRTRILQQLVFVEREWRRNMGRPPRMVVAALNPHASEGGRFGVEEERHIVPAITAARAKGLSVDGPIPADTVFNYARDGKYDVVLALYHDQATIPVKLHYGRRAVNVTLGLPFVRTSVDHGTAMDIAGKGVASEESLVQAVLLGARLVQSRRSAAESK